MQKYQYLVVTVSNADDNGLTEFLDQRGREGWELISTVAIVHGVFKFIFRSPIQ